MEKERYFNPRTGEEYFLDEEEQEIEDSLDAYIKLEPKEEKQFLDKLMEIAKAHVEARTHVDLDLATRDLDIVKYRASKLGISYKDIIKIVVHKYAKSAPEEIFL